MEVGQHDTPLQERLEGGSRKLQASQHDLSAGEGYGTEHLECHHKSMYRTTRGSDPTSLGVGKTGPT